jgi:carbamoyltransferase
MTYILGLSAYYHDSAAALLHDGEIKAAAQEERFTRIRHDPAFPENSIQFCIRQAGISISDIDHIVFYDKPLLKFERLLETHLATAPTGLPAFIKAMPVWLKEKLYLKKVLREELCLLSVNAR